MATPASSSATLNSVEDTWVHAEQAVDADAVMASDALMSAARSGELRVIQSVDEVKQGVTSAAIMAQEFVVGGIHSAQDWVTIRRDDGPPALTPMETQECSAMAYKDGPKDSNQWQIIDRSTGADEPFGWVLLKRKSGHGKCVLAFRGTDDWQDWFANTEVKTFASLLSFFQSGQNLALPRQFEQAVELVGGMDQSNLIVTGHSLGGGLANFTSILYGVPGTGKNAKPLLLVMYYLIEHAKRPIIIRFYNYDDSNDIVHHIVGLNPGVTCVVSRDLVVPMTLQDAEFLAMLMNDKRYWPALPVVLDAYGAKYGVKFILEGHSVYGWDDKMPMTCH